MIYVAVLTNLSVQLVVVSYRVRCYRLIRLCVCVCVAVLSRWKYGTTTVSTAIHSCLTTSIYNKVAQTGLVTVWTLRYFAKRSTSLLISPSIDFIRIKVFFIKLQLNFESLILINSPIFFFFSFHLLRVVNITPTHKHTKGLSSFLTHKRTTRIVEWVFFPSLPRLSAIWIASPWRRRERHIKSRDGQNSSARALHPTKLKLISLLSSTQQTHKTNCSKVHFYRSVDIRKERERNK